MRPAPRLAVVLAVVLLAASACVLSGDGPDAGSTPSATPTTATASVSRTASPTASTGVGAALPDDLRTRSAVAAAIADTARRERVAPELVVIAAWSPVTWNDGSLGCPTKGLDYTQALVDGELLLLRVGTGLFQYHARAGGPFSFCASPSAGYTVRS